MAGLRGHPPIARSSCCVSASSRTSATMASGRSSRRPRSCRGLQTSIRQPHRVDADDVTGRVGERATRVARGEPQIRLDPAASIRPRRRHRVDDARRERPSQTQRMAEGDDQSADAHGVGISQRGRRHLAARHAEHRKVRAAIGGDEVRVDAPVVGQPDEHPRTAGNVGVRHDEIGRPQDAGGAAARAVDLDRHLPEPVGDLGEVRRQRLRRAEDAHRPSPAAHEAHRHGGCSPRRPARRDRAEARPRDLPAR